MIEKLNNKDIEIAKNIHSVFQVSYKIEAEILNATDFPPLKRPLEHFVKSNTEFFGFIKDKKLVGVVEIEHNTNVTFINSLVVDPNYFKRGIAKTLMEYVINSYNSSLFVVETGLKNVPANNLYKKLHFKAVKQWNTDFGIRKIKFELKRNHKQQQQQQQQQQ